MGRKRTSLWITTVYARYFALVLALLPAAIMSACQNFQNHVEYTEPSVTPG
jgi:hypothetical protein